MTNYVLEMTISMYAPEKDRRHYWEGQETGFGYLDRAFTFEKREEASRVKTEIESTPQHLPNGGYAYNLKIKRINKE